VFFYLLGNNIMQIIGSRIISVLIIVDLIEMISVYMMKIKFLMFELIIRYVRVNLLIAFDYERSIML